MRFFGQKRILRELDYLIPALQDGLNTNIGLLAQSGHGKTTLAYLILGKLGWENCEVSGPPSFNFDPTRRFHFMDEIHMHYSPEILYPYMEEGSDYTFIVATNEGGLLKEPLYNRLIYNFVFDEYQPNELEDMCRFLFSQRGLNNVPGDFVSFIVDRSGGVPRILRNLTYRMALIFKKDMPDDVSQLQEISEAILNIDDRGLDAQEQLYIKCLSDYGPVSLGLLSSITGIHKSTIQHRIEPTLVKRGLITISPQGRQLT